MRILGGRTIAWSFRLLLAASVSGCGESGFVRHPLTGTVSYDGEPVGEGIIAFNPAPDTPGPAGGGVIQSGKYSLTTENGPVAGKHRVEIRAMRKSGRKRPEHALGAGQIEEKEQYLPEKYNSATTLEATIDSTTRMLDFKLPK